MSFHSTPLTRRPIVVLGLVAGVGIAAALSLLLGSNLIPPTEVLHRLAVPAADADAVVWGSRVPRTVLGVLVGFCLGVAGAAMQGHTRNPLADPGIFGVSAGASLAVVIGAYVLHTRAMAAMLALALVGAVIAALVVFGVAAMGRGLADPVPLAIAGTAVSALLGAWTSFIVLTDETSLAAYRIWVVGSLSGRTLSGLGAVLLVVVAGLACAAVNVRSLNNLALGADLARGLGENLLRARLVGLAAITLLTAASVAITGPIGFIGLTAPHVARAAVGGDHRWLLPASGLAGSVVMVGCDILGRLIGGQAEVSVGVVLTVLGGVVFVAIVRRGRMATL